ncbi:holo-ACP synthase [Pseudomonas aeruginosa]|nr:holo-ACP synthase [Pseudomonas aeruginosa]ELF6907599.1 holo-ACP synthase [Pseudomonas aeruginosa]MBH3513191.1 holo-ACP synthase [Pseudomonas aeruginosa]MDE4567559.1 holo-ACP synthase [Pseudomonas aeruginosa]RTT18351.1 holo-[acyl-carrier-protein] synthase [Pseudomonas aeruginosa]
MIEMPESIIKGHGLDIVDVDEFATLFSGEKITFLSRYFTEKELSATPNDQRRFSRLAGRFAAKEATLKALMTAWGDGVSFTDVEILNHSTGAPWVRLHRKLDALAKDKGISEFHISISHTEKLAVASSIAISAS